MRTIFLLLLLANLAFFAWSRGFLGELEEGREPLRTAQQLHPERLRVIGAGGPGQPVIEDCRAVSGLPSTEGEKLMALLSQRMPGTNSTLLRPGPAADWDIVIGPLTGRIAADAKIAELKKLGVGGPRMVETRPGEFSLLLGGGSGKSAADERLQSLTKKGIKSARIVQRPPADEVVVQVRGPIAALSRLPDLARGFAKGTLGECQTK